MAWAPLVFIGHTHLQGGFGLGQDRALTSFHPVYPDGQLVCEMKLESGVKYLINAGSVGQPRDHDPRAAYAIFDEEESKIFFCRAEYPIGVTQAKMEAAHLPDYLIQRLSIGR